VTSQRQTTVAIQISEKFHTAIIQTHYTEGCEISVKCLGEAMYKILVADDDKAMLQMVEQVLEHEGYDVTKARSGEEAIEKSNGVSHDLFLIDVGLPSVDGVEVCRMLREQALTAEKPIIFMTGQHNTYSVAEALEAGGDDYIRKPFAVRELTARIRAHLRRSTNSQLDDAPVLRILPNTYQVFVDDREIILTRIEFDLLMFMAQYPQKWHSTSDLLIAVWKYPKGVGDTALVRNHVRNLRRKLEENPDYPAIVQSRHGRGYSIRAHVQFTESVR
jgi:DNA-binding response OmpR family regulator